MKRHALTALLVLTLLGLILSTTTAASDSRASAKKWWVDYFDNRNLSGAPALSRYDDANQEGGVSFNWGLGSPDSAIPSDNFSARWARDEWFGGGTYRFTVASDDGVRVWVGDQLVVDEWRDRGATPLYIDRYIPAGTYRVKIEYYEHGGAAIISVDWRHVVGGTTWRGEYFDNRNLSDEPALVRADGAIDFAWGAGSPDPAIPADDFSVRWTRTLGFNAGRYRFLTSTDDGVRLFVDGNLIIDAWHKQKLPNTHTAELYLAHGLHTITVEYYEQGGEAHAHAWWQLRDLPFENWHGEYFDNPNLVGGPALERDDGADQGGGLNFDWGVGAPVEWMPDDNFSVRWTRTVNFPPGYYRFSVLSDDGFRLWLDQGILIDKWQDMASELHYIDGIYLQGEHTIRLEYYEHTGGARVRLWWESNAGGAAPSPYAPTEAIEDDPWQAAYFANSDLSGAPVLTRIETSLDHNWGWGSPGGAVPKDHFSARWTQPLNFRAGTYRFTTYTDDGVRLWVDGRLLIDSWRPMRGYRSASVYLSQGVHEVKMEYYERSGIALARLTWRQVR